MTAVQNKTEKTAELQSGADVPRNAAKDDLLPTEKTISVTPIKENVKNDAEVAKRCVTSPLTVDVCLDSI